MGFLRKPEHRNVPSGCGALPRLCSSSAFPLRLCVLCVSKQFRTYRTYRTYRAYRTRRPRPASRTHQPSREHNRMLGTEHRIRDAVAQLARTGKRRALGPMLDEHRRYRRSRATRARCRRQLLEAGGCCRDGGATGAELRLSPYDDSGGTGDREQSCVDEHDGDEQLDECKSAARSGVEDQHGAKLCIARPGSVIKTPPSLAIACGRRARRWRCRSRRARRRSWPRSSTSYRRSSRRRNPGYESRGRGSDT